MTCKYISYTTRIIYLGYIFSSNVISSQKYSGQDSPERERERGGLVISKLKKREAVKQTVRGRTIRTNKTRPHADNADVIRIVRWMHAAENHGWRTPPDAPLRIPRV